jgi:hypothetical protein
MTARLENGVLEVLIPRETASPSVRSVPLS